jgi:hypothetical protein
MAATRKKKAEDRHARKALAQDNLYPALPLSVAAVLRSEKVIHVSGRFCWVKVNGQWLYKTRQIVTGRNKLPARWMLWRPNAPQNPSAGEYVEIRGNCPVDDRCKIVLCYTSFDPRGRK